MLNVMTPALTVRILRNVGNCENIVYLVTVSLVHTGQLQTFTESVTDIHIVGMGVHNSLTVH